MDTAQTELLETNHQARKEIALQSNFLHLFDGKMVNFNGEPNSSNNSPRVDTSRGILFVSPQRQNRYVRDYIVKKIGERAVLYRRYDNKVLDLDGALNVMDIKTPQEALEKLLDIRLFGSPFAVSSDELKKQNFYKTKGTIHTVWAHSLNIPEVVTLGLTSHFASDSDKKQGTIGTSILAKYGIFASYGVISHSQAKENGTTKEDIALFDEATVNGINQYKSVSKNNQETRLYLRVEFHEGRTTVLGDLRDYITINQTVDVNSIHDVVLDVTKLVAYLESHRDKIQTIYLYEQELLQMQKDGQPYSFTSFEDVNIQFVSLT